MEEKREPMACPSCGSKRFAFISSTCCRCEYCGATWKLEDIFSVKKLELEKQAELTQKERRYKFLKDILLDGDSPIGMLICVGGMVLIFGLFIKMLVG